MAEAFFSQTQSGQFAQKYEKNITYPIIYSLDNIYPVINQIYLLLKQQLKVKIWSAEGTGRQEVTTGTITSAGKAREGSVLSA